MASSIQLFFVDITSHELREKGLKLSVNRKSNDKITLIFPETKNITLTTIKEKLNTEYKLDIQQDKVKIINEESNQLLVDISNNSKLFVTLLEKMIDQYQIQSDFSLSLRAIFNHYFWQGTLYKEETMNQLTMVKSH